jgi:hypothetical protein
VEPETETALGLEVGAVDGDFVPNEVLELEVVFDFLALFLAVVSEVKFPDAFLQALDFLLALLQTLEFPFPHRNHLGLFRTVLVLTVHLENSGVFVD